MKPKVICHVAASVDGHLQVERWSAPYEEDARGEIMGVYPEIAKSFGTDAWTFGRNTVREIFPDKFSLGNEEVENYVEDSKGNTNLAPVMQPSIYAAERHSDRMFISFDPASDKKISTCKISYAKSAFVRIDECAFYINEAKCFILLSNHLSFPSWHRS